MIGTSLAQVKVFLVLKRGVRDGTFDLYKVVSVFSLQDHCVRPLSVQE